MTSKIWSDGEILYSADLNTNFALTNLGDGSDGAFAETTGDTALTQGEVYQYTSLSLTGDATISTTKTTGEPVVILVQGDVTINTSGTCDFQGVGEDSPLNEWIYNYPISYSGTAQSINPGRIYFYSNGRTGSKSTDFENYWTWGGMPPTNSQMNRIMLGMGYIPRFGIVIASGTKGGNGVRGTAGTVTGGTAGTGGSGGGSLIILCGGNMTITSGTFNMKGANGTNGDASGASDSGDALLQGGGGGGAGSIFLGCVGTLSDSGTYQVTGGSGGSGDEYDDYNTSAIVPAGGGGASMINVGNVGGTSNTGAASGGSGGTGLAIRTELK